MSHESNAAGMWSPPDPCLFLHVQYFQAAPLAARYLALGNEREEFFELTTPLFVSNDDVFSLCVPGYKVRRPVPGRDACLYPASHLSSSSQ